jgi:preprotein translocase subunit SecB
MNNPLKPACELEDFHLNRLHIEVLDREQSDETSASLSFDYDISCRSDNPFIIKMVMKFSLVPNPDDLSPRCPYAFDVEMEGIFSFPEDIEEKKMAYLCRVNGLTILYGILRGEIATLTGSFRNGKFILPTVMMQEVVKDVEARKSKERAVPQIAEDPAS